MFTENFFKNLEQQETRNKEKHNLSTGQADLEKNTIKFLVMKTKMIEI